MKQNGAAILGVFGAELRPDLANERYAIQGVLRDLIEEKKIGWPEIDRYPGPYNRATE